MCPDNPLALAPLVIDPSPAKRRVGGGRESSAPFPTPHANQNRNTSIHVHCNHHRTHDRPAHQQPADNPTHQHASKPTRTLRRPETPHQDGRRETLVHVAGRQKDLGPRTAHDSRPSVSCRPGTALGQMTPTGPGPRSVVLQAGVALGRAARSGRPERRPRGCHCGRQDRGLTPVGLGSVPVGGPGWGVFAGGGWQWRSGAESRAGNLSLP
jgi:hypothetical protein